jgi:hypothetical protein
MDLEIKNNFKIEKVKQRTSCTNRWNYYATRSANINLFQFNMIAREGHMTSIKHSHWAWPAENYISPSSKCHLRMESGLVILPGTPHQWLISPGNQRPVRTGALSCDRRTPSWIEWVYCLVGRGEIGSKLTVDPRHVIESPI